jgi:hypothetical protein
MTSRSGLDGDNMATYDFYRDANCIIRLIDEAMIYDSSMTAVSTLKDLGKGVIDGQLLPRPWTSSSNPCHPYIKKRIQVKYNSMLIYLSMSESASAWKFPPSLISEGDILVFD